MSRITPDDQQFPGSASFPAWVRSIVPGLSDEDAMRLLWECTSYPLTTSFKELLPPVEHVRDQILAGLTLDEVIDERQRQVSEEAEAIVLDGQREQESEQAQQWDHENPDHPAYRPWETRPPNPDLL